MRKHLTPGTVLGTVAVVFACTGSATAGVLITSNSIKDGTIQARDIKKGTISTDRLASSVRTQLAKAGTPGPAGPAGPAATGRPRCTARPRRPQGASAPRRRPNGQGRAPPARRRTRARTASNPATLVATERRRPVGTFVGGGGASPYPTAELLGRRAAPAGRLRRHHAERRDRPRRGAGNDAPLELAQDAELRLPPDQAPGRHA